MDIKQFYRLSRGIMRANLGQVIAYGFCPSHLVSKVIAHVKHTQTDKTDCCN